MNLPTPEKEREQFDALRQLAQENPAEFRRVMAEARATTVIPHAGQKPVLDSQARFKVLNCGRRWGKTILAAKMAVKAARKERQMIWWVAPTYKIVKRGYAEILKQLPKDALAKPAPPDTNFDAGRSVILHFKNGTKMEFYSAERPEGMLGAAVDFCVLDEAAIMPMRIWNQIVFPTLIDHRGSALMISTPRGKNWFYDAWLRGQDEAQPNWASWTFTTQDNPTLPPGAADELAADMPRMEADQEIYAKWIAAGSNVFILDQESIERYPVLDNGMVERPQRPMGHVFLGIDLARTNDFTVLYGTRGGDRLNVYFERFQDIAWSEQRRRIRRAVRRLMKSGASAVTLVVDEGNAGNVIVEDLQEAGFDVVGVNFSTHKASMVRLLANDLERRRAFILDEQIHEFENYMMQPSPSGKTMVYSAPEGQHDDVVSAKMLAHWGCVEEGVPTATTLSPTDAPSADPVDPWEVEDDDGWNDLLDDEDEDMTEAESFEAIGLEDPSRVPSSEELMNRPDVWF